MRVVNLMNNCYFYPDFCVSDGKSKIIDGDILSNPVLIVEVATKSTEVFDKPDKFIAYRTIPSLKEYVLVSTKSPEIEIFSRENEDNWTVETIFGLDKSVNFESINLSVSLKDIYHRVF